MPKLTRVSKRTGRRRSSEEVLPWQENQKNRLRHNCCLEVGTREAGATGARREAQKWWQKSSQRAQGEELTVSIHIVNIEPDNITRNISFPEFKSNILCTILRIIRPTRLMISNTPFWRKWHISSQLRKSCNNIPRKTNINQ